MPQPKCAACGKFTSSNPTDGAKCKKCACVYHRACVNLAQEARVSSSWTCPACKIQAPRRDNTDTPVKNCDQEGEGTREMSPPRGLAPDFAEELRLFRVEFVSMKEEMAGLRHEMLEIRRTFGGFQARFEAVEERVRCLEERVEQRADDGAGSDLAGTVAELKAELNDRDQDLLLNDLEVSGIPEMANESRSHLVCLVAHRLGVALDERDIVFAERVGPRQLPRAAAGVRGAAGEGAVGGEATPGEGAAAAAQPPAGRPRPLVVRLARRAPRVELLRAARVRRGADTTDFGLPGAPSRFYVNERLTGLNRSLFYSARQECRKLDWRNPWTRDGRVFVRRSKDSPARRVRSSEDIAQVFGSGGC